MTAKLAPVHPGEILIEESSSRWVRASTGSRRTSASPPTPTAPLGPGFELVAARERELFSVWEPTTSRTPAGWAWLERPFGKAITSRTWLTIARILDRCQQGTSEPG